MTSSPTVIRVGTPGPSGLINDADWPLDAGTPLLVIYSGDLPFTNEGEIENDGERLICNEPSSTGVATFGNVFTPTPEAQYFYVRPQAPNPSVVNGKISFVQRSPLVQALDIYVDNIDDGLYWATQGVDGGLIEAGFGLLPDDERVFLVRIDEDGNVFVKTLNTAMTAVGTLPVPSGHYAMAYAVTGIADPSFIDVALQDFGSGITPEPGDIPWQGLVELPEVSAPAILTVTDGAPTRSYGGNWYGPKSNTTPGVNHFGFLMPDGVTVITLPDDSVGRAEMLQDAVSTIAGQGLNPEQQQNALDNLGVPDLVSEMEGLRDEAAQSSADSEEAKIAAEGARDAAIIQAGVYANEPTGRAAVADGVAFKVQGSGDVAAYEYRRVNSSSSALIATYPSSSLITGLIDRNQRSLEFPNLFSADELAFIDKSRVTSVAAAALLTAGTYNGSGCWEFSAPGNGATSEVRMRFPASQFTASGYINASATVVTLDASTGASSSNGLRFTIYQTNAAGATIVSSAISVAGAGAISSPQTVQQQAVALNGTAVFVEFGFSIHAGAGQPSRVLRFRDMQLAAGPSSRFALPPSRGVEGNAFPDKELTGQYSTVFTAAPIIESGEATLVMTPTAGVLTQAIWSVPAIGAYAPGALIRLTAECNVDTTSGASLTVIFYDVAGAEITAARLTQINYANNAYQTLSCNGTVPAGAVRVDIRALRGAAATVCKFRRFEVLSSGRQTRNTQIQQLGHNSIIRTIYIDGTSGSDNNYGTEASPVRTFARAMLMAGPYTRIVVAEGDYAEAPQITPKIVSLEVTAKRNARVRLIGGSAITGASKTAGRTKVWQISLASAPGGKWLFQHDLMEAYSSISADQRLPQQQGRASRLPMTRIWKVTSVADIDAASRPSWFYDSGVLYFSIEGGGDPTGVDLRYLPSTLVTAPFYNGNTVSSVSLKLTGIESWYWAYGFRTWDCSRVEFNRCKAFGALANGFEYSDTLYVRRYHCEAGANSNDGHGAHVNRANANNTQCHYDGGYNWDHDNGDDGMSHHKYWVAGEIGSLLEYNYDRGCVPAIGGHAILSDCTSRFNGQGPANGVSIDDGAGFCAAGTSGDGGVGTQLELHGCISEGNLVNYHCTGSDNRVVAHDCLSVGATPTHYGATTGGVMTLDSCRYVGTGTVKGTSGGGVISVIGSSPVT